MAFGTSSKIFSAFVRDALNITAAFDLDTHTIKAAIYGNSGTPDQTVTSANSAYAVGQWVTGNEVANGGWSTAGLALASVTSTFSSNVYTFDAADSANGSAATIADARGLLIYDDTLTTPVADQGMCYLAFGGLTAVTAGTLTIQYNASGIMTLTL
jgi:hypothetical protein